MYAQHVNSKARGVRGGAAARALACCAALLVLGVGAAVADDSAVHVELDDTRGACRVEGEFEAPVSAAVAWEVLTDYEGIGRFVRSMRRSQFEPGPDGTRRLRQDAVAGVFVFRRRMSVLLEIEEQAGARIAFRDVSGEDFTRYVGEWRISDDSGGTEVEYSLVAEPKGALARSMCRGVLKNTVRDLLAEVRTEMLRRSALRKPGD